MNNTIVNVSPRGFSPNEMMDHRGMPLFLTVHAASQYRRESEPRTLEKPTLCEYRIIAGCVSLLSAHERE